ncbi:type II CAAX prenyl endopeptidase Rce1 family protein [Dyella sp.]|uniref:CPBP family glutamic-type intramembrane protease n=1 Tax=Dyella sp. TaxID=1869338 RepID=UPI002ED224A0
MNTLPPLLPERRAHLRLAACLGLAAIFATLLLMPYVHATMTVALARLPLPFWEVALLQSLQAGILCFLLGWAGLAAGKPYRLGAPWLLARVQGRAVTPEARSHWLAAVIWGVASGLLVSALARIHPGFAGHAVAHVSHPDMAWRGALASFYGGIVEEIECRLFLVGVLVWLFASINSNRASSIICLCAIVVAALLFGAGHLPAALHAGMPLGPLALLRIIGLNAVAGIFFGVIFWRWGFEHAVIAHFCADLVLHVVMPLWA